MKIKSRYAFGIAFTLMYLFLLMAGISNGMITVAGNFTFGPGNVYMFTTAVVPAFFFAALVALVHYSYADYNTDAQAKSENI